LTFINYFLALTKGLNTSEWENHNPEDAGAFSSTGFYRSSQTAPGGHALDNAAADAEKRKSSSNPSPGPKPFLPEPDRANNSVPVNDYKKPLTTSESSSKQYGLSFTQQVQQMSRHKGRPGSRLLSPLAEPHSPIYASPPQSPSSDSVNDDRISPLNAFSNVTSYHSNEFNPSAGDLPRGNVTEFPVLNNGCGITQSFAFNRVCIHIYFFKCLENLLIIILLL
jgi:hypothetical protein